ncbi:hypothetical protein ACWD4V_31985 [Streptomyces tsukubensis]|uniref:hypothetical protein n=1 Tax=Streptomyces tsukubensis TaxID=83656 RepID=UPI0036A5336F
MTRRSPAPGSWQPLPTAWRRVSTAGRSDWSDDILGTEFAVRVPGVGSTVMTSTARYTTQDILDAEESVRTAALDRYDTRTAVLTTARPPRPSTSSQ